MLSQNTLALIVGRVCQFVLLICIVAPVTADERPSASEYEVIGKQYGIPGELLYAIAQHESRGWPWTLNIAGESYYFKTRQAACLKLMDAVANGQLVDVGLMQVSWQHNGKDLFDKPCHALSPHTNIHAGASVLARERTEAGGNLFSAIGTYHTGSEKDPERKHRAMWYRLQIAKKYNGH